MNYDKICSTIAVVVSALIVLSASWFIGILKWMADGSIVRVVIGFCGAFAAFLVLAIVFGLFSEALPSKKYREEIAAIMQEFNATKDAEKFYNNLVSMKNPPIFQEHKAMWEISLSTALFRKGSKDEALRVLDEIHTQNKRIMMLVDKQKADILTIEALNGDDLNEKSQGKN